MLYQDFGALTTSQIENRDAKCRSGRNETDKQDIGTQTNDFMVIVSVFFPLKAMKSEIFIFLRVKVDH